MNKHSISKLFVILAVMMFLCSGVVVGTATYTSELNLGGQEWIMTYTYDSNGQLSSLHGENQDENPHSFNTFTLDATKLPKDDGNIDWSSDDIRKGLADSLDFESSDMDNLQKDTDSHNEDEQDRFNSVAGKPDADKDYDQSGDDQGTYSKRPQGTLPPGTTLPAGTSYYGVSYNLPGGPWYELEDGSWVSKDGEKKGEDQWDEFFGKYGPKATPVVKGEGVDNAEDADKKKKEPDPGTTTKNPVTYNTDDGGLTFAFDDTTLEYDPASGAITNYWSNADGTRNTQTYYLQLGDPALGGYVVTVPPGSVVDVDTDELGNGGSTRYGHTLYDDYNTEKSSELNQLQNQLSDLNRQLNALPDKPENAEERADLQGKIDKENSDIDKLGDIPLRPTNQKTNDGMILTFNYEGPSDDTADTTKVDFPGGRERYVEGSLHIEMPPGTSLRSLLEAANYVDTVGTINADVINTIYNLEPGEIEELAHDFVTRNSDGFAAMDDFSKGDSQADATTLSYYNQAEDFMQTYFGGSRTQYDGWVSLTTGGDVDFEHSSGIDGTTYNPYGNVQNTFEGRNTNDDAFDDLIDATQNNYGNNQNLLSLTTGTFTTGDFGAALSSGGNINFESDGATNVRTYDIGASGDLNLGAAYAQDGSYLGSYHQDHDDGSTYLLNGGTRNSDTSDVVGVDLTGTGTTNLGSDIGKPDDEGAFSDTGSADDLVTAGLADGIGDDLEDERRKSPGQNTGDGSFFFGTSNLMDWFNEYFSSPFSGMSGWTSLFGGYSGEGCQEGHDAWSGGPNCGWADKWRENVNELFCQSVIGASMDCWISQLCETFQYADDMDVDETAFTTTASGEVVAAAHIEGERGITPLRYIGEDGMEIQYYYKLSFFAMNPLADEDLKVTIDLEYSGGTKRIGTIELESGSSYSAMGSTMQIFYSPNKYTSMKMSFSPHLETATAGAFYQGSEIPEITNTFVEVGTAPTSASEFTDDVAGEDDGDDADDGGDGSGDGDESAGCDPTTEFCFG